MVEIHGDPDMNGIAKVTPDLQQKFKVVQTDAAGHRNVQLFDLDVTLAPEEG